MKKILFLAAVFLVSNSCFAQDKDFSNYAPEVSEEDAYHDESFMYFDTRFIVSLGTGYQGFTGGAGKVFKAGWPTLDMKLAHFIDQRLALQYGVGLINYSGTMAETVNGRTGLVTLSQVRLSVDGKYYLQGQSTAPDEENIGREISPNMYFLVGLEWSRYGLTFEQSNEKFRFSGPAPCVGTGVDFSLKRNQSSLEVEGRYYPIGALFSDMDFGGLLGGTRIGNMYSINTNVKFLFQ